MIELHSARDMRMTYYTNYCIPAERVWNSSVSRPFLSLYLEGAWPDYSFKYYWNVFKYKYKIFPATNIEIQIQIQILKKYLNTTKYKYSMYLTQACCYNHYYWYRPQGVKTQDSCVLSWSRTHRSNTFHCMMIWWPMYIGYSYNNY